MNTNDIIESLNMAAISQQPIANGLLHQIADALKERDEAIATLEKWDEISPAIRLAIDDVGKLRAENERLSKELAEQSIKLLVLNEVVEERDAAIAALRQIGQAVERPDQDETEQAVADMVRTALGDDNE